MPTPGSASSSGTDDGTTPPCRSTIATAASRSRRPRPAGHPVPPDRLDAGDGGLLQHDLADQHSPRVDVRTAPRQVAGRDRVPVHDDVADGRVPVGAGHGSPVCRPPRTARHEHPVGRSTSVPVVWHPVGELPAAVYWRRRLVVLAVLLGILGGGGWLGFALATGRIG